MLTWEQISTKLTENKRLNILIKIKKYKVNKFQAIK